MKLTSNLYETAAKLVKVALNHLIILPAADVLEYEFWPTPITAKCDTESVIIYCNNCTCH